MWSPLTILSHRIANITNPSTEVEANMSPGDVGKVPVCKSCSLHCNHSLTLFISVLYKSILPLHFFKELAIESSFLLHLKSSPLERRQCLRGSPTDTDLLLPLLHCSHPSSPPHPQPCHLRTDPCTHVFC